MFFRRLRRLGDLRFSHEKCVNLTFSFGTYIFTKDHVSVLNYFRIDDNDICKIEMFDNNNT